MIMIILLIRGIQEDLSTYPGWKAQANPHWMERNHFTCWGWCLLDPRCAGRAGRGCTPDWRPLCLGLRRWLETERDRWLYIQARVFEIISPIITVNVLSYFLFQYLSIIRHLPSKTSSIDIEISLYYKYNTIYTIFHNIYKHFRIRKVKIDSFYILGSSLDGLSKEESSQ